MDGFGEFEYEFARTVSPEGVPRFREVLGITADEPLLAALWSRFERTGEIEATLEEAGIETGFWSRVGD